MKARIRGKKSVIETAKADVGWHCKGAGKCSCCLCGEPGNKPLEWRAGKCGACLGAGHLVWDVGGELRIKMRGEYERLETERQVREAHDVPQPV